MVLKVNVNLVVQLFNDYYLIILEKKLKCFVIIGYGKKTSYANGKHRDLDLNQTFDILLKPVFDELGIECYRAIDKNITGSIDELMLREIKDADIALADISTLNANVMWELGVRHALKENYTIMICEQEQMAALPFDVNHFPVYSYVHSENGIPYVEVERFRKILKTLVEKMLAEKPPILDSPVFQFVKLDKKEVEKSEDRSNKGGPKMAGSSGEPPTMAGDEEKANNESFADIIKKAELAKDSKKYEEAFTQYSRAKELVMTNMTLRNNLTFVVSRQALCYHKAAPDDLKALKKSLQILEELNPKSSNDIEVVGIAGGINKRLHQMTNDDKYLKESIWFYERGFQMKQDYFNGINAAFMLYILASELKSQDKEYKPTKLRADYITSEVLRLCEELEEAEDFSNANDAIWILYTLGEVHHYLGNKDKQLEYEKKGDALAKKSKDSFAPDSYYEQQKLIDKIIRLEE
jgi:MAP3K TRAFs-binding domain